MSARPFTPWNSIAESIVERGEEILDLAQAVESPCKTCSTSPCCTHLPLNTFRVTNLVELDHARYLLNFDRIELAISATGDWSAYYVYPCRYLDRSTFECSVHGTADQPTICVNYSPYNCWYRRVFSDGQGPELVRIDRARMDLLISLIEFDDSRSIVSVPEWDALVEMMAAFTDQPAEPAPEPPGPDKALIDWERTVLAPAEIRLEPPARRSYAELIDPCTGCAAYCCISLVFPQSPPAHVSNLDFYRFCLGFPGIELGIGDDQWSLIVRTTCRHLVDSRCSIYGQPERPFICRYYDQWKCMYRPQFGQARPATLMRIRLEHFPLLAQAFAYAPDGTILEMPRMEAIRQGIEVAWRERGALGGELPPSDG